MYQVLETSLNLVTDLASSFDRISRQMSLWGKENGLEKAAIAGVGGPRLFAVDEFGLALTGVRVEVLRSHVSAFT